MIQIGIPAVVNDNNLGVHVNYLEFIKTVGGTPVLIDPVVSFDYFSAIYNIDALLLPGGPDVNPLRYDAIPKYGTGRSNPLLEYFDTQIVYRILGSLPIFGICRGFQTLNVLTGGTLLQEVFHKTSISEEDLVHEVCDSNILKESKLRFKVNSFHHQGLDVIGNNVDVILYADDGLPEAIESHVHRFFAVQWHPERQLDLFSIKKFKQLLKEYV